MGRYYYGEGRYSVDDYSKTVDIEFLKKYGYLDQGNDYKIGNLQWTRNGESNGNIGIEVTKCEYNGYLRVFFTQTSTNQEEKRLDYKIPLVSTPCNYGGVRWWFLCPCKSNRCSKLYLQNNGIFASRKTLNLCYDEQKKSKKWRDFGKIMGDDLVKIDILKKQIKYPYRNGKPTRKMRRVLKLLQRLPTERKMLDLLDKTGWI